MLTDNPMFERFLDDVRNLLAGVPDEAAMLQRGRAIMARLVAGEDWLPDDFTVPHPEHFKQYMLHREPDGSFTVLGVVWGPGQSATPHDHTIWGIVGQLRGAERTRVYESAGQGNPLRTLSSVTLAPGDTTIVSPASGDIHDVENVGDGVAISIHLYGGDLERLASRRSRFDAATGAMTPFEASYH